MTMQISADQFDRLVELYRTDARYRRRADRALGELVDAMEGVLIDHSIEGRVVEWTENAANLRRFEVIYRACRSLVDARYAVPPIPVSGDGNATLVTAFREKPAFASLMFPDTPTDLVTSNSVIRLFHDAIGHIGILEPDGTFFDFTDVGERLASERAARFLPSSLSADAWSVYWLDSLGQNAYLAERGHFPAIQVPLLVEV